MKIVNNFHVISKGTLLSLLFRMFLLGFIVVTGFNTSLATLTGVLIISTAAASFYVGTISDRYAEINGIIVSLLVSFIVIGFLYFYVPTNLKANEVIVVSYVVIGFLFSLLSRLTNKKLRIEKKGSEKKIPKTPKMKVKPSNDKLLSEPVASKPLKHSAKKKVVSYTNPTAPKSVETSDVVKEEIQAPSEQANIRKELLKEIEREKAQRKNKK